MERREVIYSGHVQGVGFRYTAQGVARHFDVTGFVRNLDDGRVELVAEGSGQELDAFFAEISSRMGHYIRDAKLRSGPSGGEFVDFRIRF